MVGENYKAMRDALTLREKEEPAGTERPDAYLEDDEHFEEADEGDED